MARPKKRNSNGEGSLFYDERKKLWSGYVSVGYQANGKIKRRCVYGKTKEITREKMLAVEHELHLGDYIDPTTLKVGEWLQFWFDNYFLRNHRASTATIYREHITGHIVPTLGALKLQKLRVENAQALVNEKRSLAPATVAKMVEVLKAALKQAVVNGLIQKSPVEGVILPKHDQKEIEFLTVDEQKALYEALPDTDNGRAIRFIIATGLRISELVGLRWSDVAEDSFTVRQGFVRTANFDAKEGDRKTTLTAGAPKSKAGKRTIPITPLIRALLGTQRSEYLQRRLAAGPDWQEHNLVFSSDNGSPKDPANIRRTLSRALDKAGLKHRGVHALRHTFATNYVRVSSDYVTLARLMGHSKVGVTLQLYCHSDDQTARETMELMWRMTL